MGLLHRATITPTKPELIAGWAPNQPWGPPAGSAPDLIGSFRFDDPENGVGMETHLVTAGDELFQIPLTYRGRPLDGAEGALVGEMEHSALGTRWVYDGLRDERFVVMLAAASLTGQGEALGLADHDGRWYVAPASVRIEGGGWTRERVAVDGFEPVSDTATAVGYRNDRFELTFFRRPAVGPRPPIGLVATWDGQPEPVVLTEIREL